MWRGAPVLATAASVPLTLPWHVTEGQSFWLHWPGRVLLPRTFLAFTGGISATAGMKQTHLISSSGIILWDLSLLVRWFCCFVGFFCLSADIPCTPLLFLIYPAFYLCFLYLSLCQDFTANVDNQSYTKPIMRTHESNVLLVISFCFSFWEPQQKFQRKHILPCGKFGSSAIS